MMNFLTMIQSHVSLAVGIGIGIDDETLMIKCKNYIKTLPALRLVKLSTTKNLSSQYVPPYFQQVLQ